jgi:DNA ligase-1
MKPQLANDADIDTMQYPVWAMPKIDGVRGLNPAGTFVGRSLDEFKAFGLTQLFSGPATMFLDGELTLGADPVGDGLCRLTSGAVKAFKGVTEVADFHWWLFDYVNDDIKHVKYKDRYQLLVDWFNNELGKLDIAERLHIVPYIVCNNREEADAAYLRFLNEGYEGVIYRNPEAPAKEGRPGVKAQELVRLKPWVTSEGEIVELIEGAKNTNEAKKNTLGRTERSSSKAGQVPNGEVGAVKLRLIADVYHPVIKDKLLFPAGKIVQVGAGELKVDEAKRMWEERNDPEKTVIGKIGTIKHFAHDVKDNVRMGTFVTVRDPVDMS